MTESKNVHPVRRKHAKKLRDGKVGLRPVCFEAPPAPEGFVHRWVRTAIRGEDDKTNLHARLREGWEPVRADVRILLISKLQP